MISIIVPLYNERDNIELLHKDIVSALKDLTVEYEIVYVDDGSKDGSFEILSKIAVGDDCRVKVIQLKSNFGQTAAISAGIDCSKGDILVLMDGDRQNDPKDIPRLLRKMDEGYDMVSGWRRNRKDPLFTRRIPSYIANRLISYLTGVRLRDFGCTLKAYKRDLLQGIKLYGRMHRLIPVYAASKGASLVEVEVSHHRRKYGNSKYSLLRTFEVFIDVITVLIIHSGSPAYIFGGIGFVMFFVGIAIIIPTLIFSMQRGILLAILLFIMGIQFLFMGLLVEILIRVYYKSQGWPGYLINKIVSNKE